MVMGRIVYNFTPSASVFKIKAWRFGLIFVMLDVVAFMIQLAGLASVGAANKPNKATFGIHICKLTISRCCMYVCELTHSRYGRHWFPTLLDTVLYGSRLPSIHQNPSPGPFTRPQTRCDSSLHRARRRSLDRRTHCLPLD